MRSRVMIAAVGAVVASACHTAPPEPVSSRTPPVSVAVFRIERGDLASTFEAGGIVRARSTAAIASRVMAPIAEVHVRAGDRVMRGQRLITLDAREMHANNARAAATLESSDEGVRAAEADTRAAQAAVELARATHERTAQLHATRSATPQELDQAIAALAAAQAQLAAAERRTAAAAAGRNAARASNAAAAIAASYTVITAPFDGVVTSRAADPGSMAIPGTVLLTVDDSRAFRLEVGLDEARAGVAPGDSVHVRVDENGGWVAGRVSEIARIDPNSHSFLVKIDLPLEARWRSGQFGRARFTGPTRSALTVPSSALVNRGQLTFVYVVDAEGAARLRPVTAATSSGGPAEILAGLSEGDLVVIDPPASLADGTPVTANTARRGALPPAGAAR